MNAANAASLSAFARLFRLSYSLCRSRAERRKLISCSHLRPILRDLLAEISSRQYRSMHDQEFWQSRPFKVCSRFGATIWNRFSSSSKRDQRRPQYTFGAISGKIRLQQITSLYLSAGLFNFGWTQRSNFETGRRRYSTSITTPSYKRLLGHVVISSASWSTLWAGDPL